MVLVATVAGPLAGDRHLVEVDLGEGAGLEVVGNAATLAFPAASPRGTTSALRLGGGRAPRLAAQPLILAARLQPRGVTPPRAGPGRRGARARGRGPGPSRRAAGPLPLRRCAASSRAVRCSTRRTRSTRGQGSRAVLGAPGRRLARDARRRAGEPVRAGRWSSPARARVVRRVTADTDAGGGLAARRHQACSRRSADSTIPSQRADCEDRIELRVAEERHLTPEPDAPTPHLVEALRARGFRVPGPVVRDGAIVYDDLESAADLPVGWTDRQEAGTTASSAARRGALRLCGRPSLVEALPLPAAHPAVARPHERGRRPARGGGAARRDAARLHRRALLRAARDRDPGQRLHGRPGPSTATTPPGVRASFSLR